MFKKFALISILLCSLGISLSAVEKEQQWEIFSFEPLAESEVDHPVGNYLLDLKVEYNKDTGWEKGVVKTLKSFYNAAATGNFEEFRKYFITKDEAKLKSLFAYWKPRAEYWKPINLCYGKHKHIGNTIFVAFGSDEEPLRTPENKPTTEVRRGFKQVFYFQKENNDWKIDALYSDKKLEAKLDDQIFSVLIGHSLAGDSKRASNIRNLAQKVKAEKEIAINDAEVRRNELEWRFESYSEDFSKKEIIEKHDTISKLNQSTPLDDDIGKRFRYAIKNWGVKILQRPVLFTNITEKPLEKPTDSLLGYVRYLLYQDSNSELARKRKTDAYLALAKGFRKTPDEKVVKSIQNELSPFESKGITAAQLLAYQKTDFEGKTYWQVWFICYNPNDYHKDLQVYNLDAFYYSDKNEWGKLPHEPFNVSSIRKFGSIEWERLLPDFYASPTYKNGLNLEKYLKEIGISEYLFIKPESDCVPYKPGMDFQTLPTIDPSTVPE